jgi:hypothetical protein
MNARLELAKVRLGVLLAPFPFGTRDLFLRWDRMGRAWANPKMTKKTKAPTIDKEMANDANFTKFLDDAIWKKMRVPEMGTWDSVSTYTFTAPTGQRKKAYFSKKPKRLEGESWICDVKYFEE